MQLANDGTQQPLLLESGVVAIEAEQIIKIDRGLWMLQQRTVGLARRQIDVPQIGVWCNLIEKDVHADSRQSRLLVRPGVRHMRARPEIDAGQRALEHLDEGLGNRSDSESIAHREAR